MNRIVRDSYPVAALPEDLREGFDAGASVRIVIEGERHVPEKVLSLDELFAMRAPPFKTPDQINEEVRQLRDEWDG